VQATVIAAGAKGAEPGAGIDSLTHPHGNLAHRQVGDPPRTAAQRDDLAGPSRDDAAAAGRADGRARRGREIDPAVPAAQERLRAVIRERARHGPGHRSRPGDGRCRGRRWGRRPGEEQKRERGGNADGPGHRRDATGSRPRFPRSARIRHRIGTVP
jgi:hypothetical protein